MSEITIDQELSFAINSWLQHLKNIKKYSPHTLKSYITDLYYFLTFIHEHHASGLNIKLMASLEVRDFRSWLAKRKLDGSKNTSSARALSVVRGFFKFLEKNYEFKNHELTFIKVKKLEKPLPKALNEQSVMLILDSISNVRGNWIDNRNRAILMLLYGAGLRISEAISICLKDIPKSSDTPFRIVGKGNKEKEIFLIPIIIDSIQEYIKACPFDVSNGPIFLGKNGGALAAGTFRKDLQTLRRLLNLPEYTTPHAFRHSFATHLLSKGGDIRVVQELLRHEAISTTQRYTKVDTFHLIDSYLKFHPKS